MVFHGTRLVFHRAERRRREARHETYITPKLVTTRRSILGPPAEGRPGPSDDDDDDDNDVPKRLVGNATLVINIKSVTWLRKRPLGPQGQICRCGEDQSFQLGIRI